jgi:hypothetical protein
VFPLTGISPSVAGLPVHIGETAIAFTTYSALILEVILYDSPPFVKILYFNQYLHRNFVFLNIGFDLSLQYQAIKSVTH